MRSAIVIIGSEITSGGSKDTNSSYIARKLTQNGLNCRTIVAVADDINEICATVKELLLKDIDIIVMTGGLGSTHDDVTRVALAEALGVRLVKNEDLVERLSGHIPRGTEADLFMRQAYLPVGASPILLDRGTAPGIMIKVNNKSTIISVPGVPGEMRDMLEIAFAKIKDESDHRIRVHEGSLNVFGMSEPELAKTIQPIVREFHDIDFTILAQVEKIRIIYSKLSDDPEDEKRILSVKDEIADMLKDRIFSEGTETMQAVVAGQLIDKGLTLSTAESCTGGMISKMVTDIPGSSRYYLGGVAAYSNELKSKVLSVSHETLKKYGAVSQEAATQMSTGVRRLTNSDIAIAVTGIAGPGSDDSGKPVGLVYISISDDKGSSVQKYNFRGSRDKIRRRTAQTALNTLRLHIR